MELRHDDLTLFGKTVEHRPKRDPHAEPTNENPRSCAKTRAGFHAEFFFRTARPTVHEHSAVQTDQEVVLAALSQLEYTVGAFPPIQRLPRPTHARTHQTKRR